jgi:hypothetical protein
MGHQFGIVREGTIEYDLDDLHVRCPSGNFSRIIYSITSDGPPYTILYQVGDTLHNTTISLVKNSRLMVR